MQEILNIIILTLTPFLELRASIPYGVFSTNLSLTTIFFTAVISNIFLAVAVYFFLNYLVDILLKINFINNIYQKNVLRVQNKIQPYIKKYGTLGLAIFIGIPLPGSGVYSGALGAYLLGFKTLDFLKSAIIGVLIAGVIVLLVSTAGNEALRFLIKV